MKIEKIWFDADYIYGMDETGHNYRQSFGTPNCTPLPMMSASRSHLALTVSTGGGLTKMSVLRVSAMTMPSLLRFNVSF